LTKTGRAQPTSAARLAAAVLAGERTALSRALSLVESGSAIGYEIHDRCYARSGGSLRIAVTGPPGAGKSTLLDRLIAAYRARGEQVGAILVDPSSPVAGALLGDRLRMSRHTRDNGVFIRSMANRGRLGGIAPATREAIRLLEAAGYSVVIVETVGVGQADFAVANCVDCTLFVTVPGAGDIVQALKSGITEVADVIVVNKADLPESGAMSATIASMLEIRQRGDQLSPVLTSGLSGAGTDALIEAIRAFVDSLRRGGGLRDRRLQQMRGEIEALLAEAAHAAAVRAVNERGTDDLVMSAVAGSITPRAAALATLSGGGDRYSAAADGPRDDPSPT
jgi:LAO/AO transport system kinase